MVDSPSGKALRESDRNFFKAFATLGRGKGGVMPKVFGHQLVDSLQFPLVIDLSVEPLQRLLYLLFFLH